MIVRLITVILTARICYGNPDAKRLYDDLLSNYNRLIRPVLNNTDTVVVKLGLRLSQLIDLVRKIYNLFTSFKIYIYYNINILQKQKRN